MDLCRAVQAFQKLVVDLASFPFPSFPNHFRNKRRERKHSSLKVYFSEKE